MIFGMHGINEIKMEEFYQLVIKHGNKSLSPMINVSYNECFNLKLKCLLLNKFKYQS